jgi:hypothetical protein
MQFGYSSVFLAAGVVAVLNSVAALFIRVPKLSPPTE